LVKGLSKIAITPDHSISNVFLVDSLDYNLLSISQLCKMSHNYLFSDTGVTVFRRSDDSIAFKRVLEGQLYLVDFKRAELDTCLIAKTNMGWLWHRRLAHVGMKNLHKLLKGEHTLGLTNVHFEKYRICSACQAGKQVGVHHPHKNIMTTRDENGTNTAGYKVIPYPTLMYLSRIRDRIRVVKIRDRYRTGPGNNMGG
jgi:hypothetical protein